MQGPRHGTPHLLYAVILAQFILIAILLGGLSNEYLSNDYYRGWINTNYPWLGFLLQGQVDALLVGVALGATVLLILTVRHDGDVEPQIRSQSNKTLATLQTDTNKQTNKTEDKVASSSTQDTREDVLSELARQEA